MREGFKAHEVVNDGINDGINGGINDGVDRQSQIVNIIRETAPITVAQIAIRLNVSKSTIERELRALKDIKIKRVGSVKSGHWEVIE